MRASSRLALVAASSLVLTGLSVLIPSAAHAVPKRVTVSFPVGQMSTWTVPAGVTAVTFDLKGGKGGSSNGFTAPGDTAVPGTSAVGGSPARVKASVAVTPGQQFEIRVGGQGTFGQHTTVAPGGYNGGGTGRNGAGGGGGASDVRPVGGNAASRLLVAAGGGGAGAGRLANAPDDRVARGGAGGDAEGAGADGRPGMRDAELVGADAGKGGGAGQAGSGGAGGAGAMVSATTDPGRGGNGAPGQGGNTALTPAAEFPLRFAGGGGGSGWYGGGAGGYGATATSSGTEYAGGGGGGGGGSSWIGTGAANLGYEIGTYPYDPDGWVTVSYLQESATEEPLTVTVDKAWNQPDPTTGGSIAFDVVFSEPVTELEAKDFSVTGTAGASEVAQLIPSPLGDTYQVLVAEPMDPGTVRVSLPAGHAKDAMGRWNPTSTSTDNVVQVNKTPDPRDQSIHFTQPVDVEAKQSVGLYATASSGLPVTFTSLTPSVCTITSGDVASTSTPGECTIAADQAGDSVFRPAPQVTTSFQVLKRSQTIVVHDAPVDTEVGTPDQGLYATATSSLPVVYASLTPSVCTTVGASVRVLAPGQCTVAFDQPGDSEWTAAPQVIRSATVSATKKSQTITFAQPDDLVFAGPDAVLSASASSGLPVTFTATPEVFCQVVEGNKLRAVLPGSCTVHADQPGNSEYAPAERVTRTVLVDKASQAITFTQPADTVYGGADVGLSASLSPGGQGRQVMFTSVTPEVCSIVEGKARPLAAGTCTVAANQAGTSTYHPAPEVRRSLTVEKASQSLTFAQPADGVYGGDDISLSATASSGLPVSFSTSTPSVCSIVSGKVRPVAAGTCVVTATQAGNGNYQAATSVTRTLVVSKASQSIWFNQPGDVVLGAGSIALAATASSGLTVAFSSLTPGVCTVATGASTAVPVAVGECRVAADQAGNVTYLPATRVVRSVQVLAPACSDGLDNDGNGAADYPADFGCTSELDNSESSPVACGPTTKTGTSAMNIILGTFGDDTVFAGGGADTVYGYSGVDCLAGEDGNDTLWGGSDTDQLLGGAGNDNLYGEGDDDVLYGGAGDDFLDGGFGDDRLNGGPGADTLWGGFGDDTIYAVDGVKDTIDCGFGTDTVYADPVDKVTGCETIIRRTP